MNLIDKSSLSVYLTLWLNLWSFVILLKKGIWVFFNFLNFNFLIHFKLILDIYDDLWAVLYSFVFYQFFSVACCFGVVFCEALLNFLSNFLLFLRHVRQVLQHLLVNDDCFTIPPIF